MYCDRKLEPFRRRTHHVTACVLDNQSVTTARISFLRCGEGGFKTVFASGASEEFA